MKKIILALLISCIVGGCSDKKIENKSIVITPTVESNLTFESPPIMENITQRINDDFKKSASPKENNVLVKNKKNVSQKRFVIINYETPNLYRASLKTHKTKDYLASKNNIYNESVVYFGQKIYY